MRIIGITYTTDACTKGVTTLVHLPICTLDPELGRFVVWFFSQNIPLFGVLKKGQFAIRVQTDCDPFRHLRKDKCAKFDGKGLTLERNELHAGIIRIDHSINIPMSKFELLCPGLFYGTAKYPSLNLLVSHRLFRHHAINPERIWSIIYDRLCCQQFSERQDNVGAFKQEMRRKYLVTQLTDYRPKIAELQQRIALSNEQSRQNNKLQEMIIGFHSQRVNMYSKDVKNLRNLQNIVEKEKQQLVISKQNLELELATAALKDYTRDKICEKKYDLEDMLDGFMAELCYVQSYHEAQDASERSKNELLKMIVSIEKNVDKISKLENMEYRVETAKCAIENVQSLLRMAKIKEASDKKTYLNSLQNLEQTLPNNKSTADLELENAEKGIELCMHELRAFKDSINSSETNTASNVDDIVDRLQLNIANVTKIVLQIATLHKHVFKHERKAKQMYLQLPTVAYEELIMLASVQFAVAVLCPSVKQNFKGFIYEQAMEKGYEFDLKDSVLYTAIFQSTQDASRVKRLIESEHNVRNFKYIVIEGRKSNILHTYIVENLQPTRNGPIKGDWSSMNTAEMVTKLDACVQSLVEKFQAMHQIKMHQEELTNMLTNKREIKDELDRWRSSVNYNRVSFNHSWLDLPKSIARCATTRNQRCRLQARHDSLKDLMHQIRDTRLPTEEQLKTDELRLTDQLNVTIREAAVNKNSYCSGLSELNDLCDALELASHRYEVDRSATEGIPSVIYQKLTDGFTECCKTIRRSLADIEDVTNELELSEDAPSPTVEELEADILSLDIREKSFAARVASAVNVLEEYQRETRFWTQHRQSQFSRPLRTLPAPDVLLDRIVQAQAQLRQMPPGYKPQEMANMKKKIGFLQELEKQRLSSRTMCLNNLILPVIDKLHVQKLRHVTRLVAAISQDLPELGGTVQLSFGYAKPDASEDDDNPDEEGHQDAFNLHQITAANIHIIADDGEEILPLSQQQTHLASLIVFISFLYIDGCKMVVLDQSFQDLFFGGIVTILSMLKTYYPNMQFIVI